MSPPTNPPKHFPHLLRRLSDYWFRGGGLYGISISRILLFVAVYEHCVRRDLAAFDSGAATYYASVNTAAYDPKGLVLLFFRSSPPPAWLVDSLCEVAGIAAICSIIGLATRIAMPVSILSISFLLALTFSWQPYWSHNSNVIVLAGIAFMFGRAGDYLSIDFAFKRYVLKLKHSELFHTGSYWWPVLLAQAAVALFYFAAFYAKISGSDWHWDLSWVFSDNLRNSLLRPWTIFDSVPPWQVLFAASHPVVWQLVAAGHLANQALPIFALFTRRPWARLFEGIIFAMGAPLLGLFMGIWNLYWMTLATFFIDWDYFLAGAGLRSPLETSAQTPETAGGSTWRRPVASFIAVFLAFDIATFTFRLSPYHKIYPFSWMGFYSAVEARKPYERHQPYTILNGQLILHQGARTQDIVSMWQLTTLYLPAFGNVPYLAERISSAKSAAAILAPFERQPYDVNGKVFDVSGWTRLDLNAALVQIPAYPSPPARIIAHAALVASYDRTLDIVRAAGAGVTYNSQIERTQLQIEVSGFAVPKIELLYRPDPWANGDGEPLLPLPGTLDGKTFTVDDPDFRPGPGSWTPVVIRVREGENGEPFDFFGPILYR